MARRLLSQGLVLQKLPLCELLALGLSSACVPGPPLSTWPHCRGREQLNALSISSYLRGPRSI
jgi:hypothetical protein